jgi:alkanesulfonate monooxygenase SsuD/methylene tetrahydromethanopterin reductase-like flavin-dependent oxidoreductase (luciferase family)
MRTDLVLSPFDANLGEIVAAAQAAEAGRYDAVWTYDHFSGLVTRRRWSRDPWVVLAAIAARTERIKLGVLVANAGNRHAAQLACAINSLQSLAPGRLLLGVGAGAAASSQWTAEFTAISQPVPDGAVRRAILADTIVALRALWAGDGFAGEHVSVAPAMAVTDGSPPPPIVVGASGRPTIDVACTHADGVNLLPGDDLAERIAYVRERTSAGFEISVFDRFDAGHPLGGEPGPLAVLGVARRTLWTVAPFPIDAIRRIGAALA